MRSCLENQVKRVSIIYLFRFSERLVSLGIAGGFAPVKRRDRSVYLTPLHNARERNWRAAKPSLDARVSIIGTRWKLRRLSVARSSIENRFESGGVIASSRTSPSLFSLSLSLSSPPSPFSPLSLSHPCSLSLCFLSGPVVPSPRRSHD